jgi:hypothetical protein
MKDVPPGDYYVQALVNVYTQFHRSDGHVIWAHMDNGRARNSTARPAISIARSKKFILTTPRT